MKACMIRYIWDRFIEGFNHAWDEFKIAVGITLMLGMIGGVAYGVVKGLSLLLKAHPAVVILALTGYAVLATIAHKIYAVIRDAKQYCEGEGK